MGSFPRRFQNQLSNTITNPIHLLSSRLIKTLHTINDYNSQRYSPSFVVREGSAVSLHWQKRTLISVAAVAYSGIKVIVPNYTADFAPHVGDSAL